MTAAKHQKGKDFFRKRGTKEKREPTIKDKQPQKQSDK